ncbi:hypothetical protein [Spirosoma fluminis]
MQKKNTDIRQFVKWVGGLFIVWLFTSLLFRPETSAAESDTQTFIKPDTPAPETAPRNVPELRGNVPVALISSHLSFSPSPSPLFLQRWVSEFHRAPGITLIDQPHRSYYSSCFLRLILEHQITINAP